MREEDRRDEVVCLISLLAPVYVIYASHSLDTGPFAEAWTRYPPLPPEFQPYEARLAALIESTFGSTRLPNEVLFTPVPDLAVRAGNVHLGRARLIDLRQHLHSAEARAHAWQNFVRQVEEAFPGCDVSYSNTPSPYRPSYRCGMTLPGREPSLDRIREDSVVCMLSVLAPVYALYAHHWKDDRTERESWTRYPPLPPEFQAHEAKLASLVEAAFGFARLPNDVLFTAVPDLCPPSGRSQHRAPWLVDLIF